MTEAPDKPKVTVTEVDRIRAGDLLLCTSDNYHARRDAIALALAETREQTAAPLRKQIALLKFERDEAYKELS